MELPKELVEKIYKLISSAKADGKIRRGANEATKSLERGEAKLVAYASDVSPNEIVMHFAPLGKEKGIPVAAVPAKAELGAAAGLPVGTAAIAVANPGENKKLLADIAKMLETLAGGKAAPKEEKKETPKPEEKPAPKEEKKEEPKAEPKKEEKAEEKPEAAKPEAEPKESEAEVAEKAKPEEEPKAEPEAEKAKPEEEPKE